MPRKNAFSDVDEVVADVVIMALVVEVKATLVTDALVVIWVAVVVSCSAYCFEGTG